MIELIGGGAFLLYGVTAIVVWKKEIPLNYLIGGVCIFGVLVIPISLFETFVIPWFSDIGHAFFTNFLEFMGFSMGIIWGLWRKEAD